MSFMSKLRLPGKVIKLELISAQKKPPILQPCCVWLIIGALLFTQLSGCASKPTSVPQARTTMAEVSDYEGFIDDLKRQFNADPQNFSLLIRLREAEHAAVEFYLSKGESLEAVGDVEGALSNFDAGLKIKPNSYPLLAARGRIEDARAIEKLLFQSNQLVEKGALPEAKELIDTAMKLDASNPEVFKLHKKIQDRIQADESSRHLIDLKFDNLEFKKAITFVAKTYGINVVFDDGIRDTELTLDLEGIPFSQAIKVLTEITRNGYKVLNKDTLLIFPDNNERRRQYDEIVIRTFVLETMIAKDMGVLLRSALGIKNITINEANNAVILKETAELCDLAEQLIRANDVSPGEVVLDVEILEINLSEAEKLGIDYGNYQISTLTTAVPTIGSISDSIQNATTLSIPSINLNAFKQAVDAKMLAKPSVRVLDGQKAKIHIGDRVPLRQSSIQDATGQTRTTFEYQEIGIRFNVEAKIHPNDQVTVQVALEVSALGENLGTATEQAFRIGTRNADTTMLVRDGETAILGGLLREEGRSTTSGINGLSSVDILKKIFGSEDISRGRTDLLLTITPNIIRRSRGVNINEGYIAAGTEASLRDRSRADQLDKLVLKPQSSEVVAISTEREKYKLVIDAEPEQANPDTTEAPHMRELSDSFAELLEISFEEAEYQGEVGNKRKVAINFNRPINLTDVGLTVSFNPNILSIEDIQPANNQFEILESTSGNRSSFSIKPKTNNGTMLTLQEVVTFDATPKRRGTSFLAIQIDKAVNEAEEEVKIKNHNSRFVVK